MEDSSAILKAALEALNNGRMSEGTFKAVLARVPATTSIPTTVIQPQYGPGWTYTDAPVWQQRAASNVASTEVFGTPELLEKILLQNTVGDLIVATRVSRTWHDTTKGSAQLLRPLFRSAVGGQVAVKIAPKWNESLDSARWVHPLLDPGKTPTFLVNPFIRDFLVVRPRPAGYVPFWKADTDRLEFNWQSKHDNCEKVKLLLHSWADMLITQPPRPCTGIFAPCGATFTLHARLEAKASQGLTMADLLMKVQFHRDFCFECRHGARSTWTVHYDRESGREVLQMDKPNYLRQDILSVFDGLNG
ncbi:hypothetical protein Slin15195_G058100 [Septoria linicola]|uniref:F-box domain-containing protein n=1 Tax=Septoria linicola TaxID=215465 RepID=A0A9Q9AV86_9PEZI|nr:hypothetical protein Slin14017_G073950 [Septoria linicola]USW52491.1 hypothetical protein Slin15195_G058100 [Septoria linicola]